MACISGLILLSMIGRGGLTLRVLLINVGKKSIARYFGRITIMRVANLFGLERRDGKKWAIHCTLVVCGVKYIFAFTKKIMNST